MVTSKIKGCAMQECAYNRESQCHTAAITVGGSHPLCDTFLNVREKGGAMDMIGSVGACKAGDCAYNQSSECSAPGINVGHHSDHGDCMTYKKK